MTTVFVSGCYDGLHSGHLEFFRHARRLGDRVVVSIASDETIRQVKKREPLIREHDRYLMVAAMDCVDEAFVCRGQHNARDCLSYLRNYQVGVWLLIDDDALMAEKRRIADELGIELVISYRPEVGYTTSRIIESIEERGVRAPSADVGIARTGGAGSDPRQRPVESY